MLDKLKLCLLSLVFASGVVHAEIISAQFQTVDQGSTTHFEERVPSRLIEIYSLVEWKSFWKKHTYSGIPSLSMPDTPSIDFDEYFVLVAIEVEENSGIDALNIDRVEVDTELENRPFKIYVTYEQSGSGAATIDVNMRPFHIVKVKK